MVSFVSVKRIAVLHGGSKGEIIASVKQRRVYVIIVKYTEAAQTMRKGGEGMSSSLQRMNRENKLAMWTERVSACRSSGQSVKSWCRENGVSEQTYYKWQRKLLEELEAQRVQFAAVPVPVSNRAVAAVEYGAVRVEVYAGADSETLQALLRAVREC